MKKVTYESIGKKLGVSKVAVYKALNDKDGVSKELRQKIKAVAKQSGYQFVNSVEPSKKHFLFMVRKEYFLKANEQFYTSIYYYLVEECKSVSGKIEILFTERNEEFSALTTHLKESKSTAYDGIFIAGPVEKDFLSRFQNIKIPSVFIDFYSPVYRYNYVYLNNYDSAFAATEYLIQNGHRQIGFIGNIESTTSICDRFYGYRKALTQNGIEFNPDFHINQNLGSTGLAMEPSVLPEHLPSAFICHCDNCAEILYLLLKLRGIRIPEDISVISFDNTSLCSTLTPTLSSIGIGKDEFAKKSFELMMALINHPVDTATVILNPTLQKRESVQQK